MPPVPTLAPARRRAVRLRVRAAGVARWTGPGGFCHHHRHLLMCVLQLLVAAVIKGTQSARRAVEMVAAAAAASSPRAAAQPAPQLAAGARGSPCANLHWAAGRHRAVPPDASQCLQRRVR